MSSEERKFEQVLDFLAEKEKRAQKRATLLTVLTLAVGLALMAGLFYQIVRLRNIRTGLEQDVKTLGDQKVEAKEGLNRITSELDTNTKQLDAVKKEYEDVVKNIRAKNYAKALQIASTGIIKDSVSRPAGAPGFVDDRNFKGPAQTRITITIIPDRALLASPTRPNNLYTYQVEGEQTHFMTGQTSFVVMLDRSKTVSLIFDFAKEGLAGYTIKQTATAGKYKTKQFHIDPLVTRVGRPISLHFSVQ